MFDEEQPYVEVEVGPQTFERRTVELGLSDGIHVEIKSGVTADDLIKIPGNAGRAGMGGGQSGGRPGLGASGPPRRAR